MYAVVQGERLVEYHPLAVQPLGSQRERRRTMSWQEKSEDQANGNLPRVGAGCRVSQRFSRRKVERMADEKRHEPRPLWVRMVVRDTMKRPAALVVVGIFVLLACCCLLAVAIESASSSELGAIALPLGITATCLSGIGAVWCWLAIRWVDRNSKWA